MNRDRRCFRILYCFHRIEDRIDCRVALWRACHIRDRLRQNNLCLRHTDTLNCLCCRCCDNECHRIGIAHILRCADHNSSCDELNIFPRIKHSGKIINCCIRVRAAHAFDKRRDCIVMVISCFIIAHHTFLDTFTSYLKCDMDFSIITPLRCQNAKFDRCERCSCVSVCHIRKKIQCLFLNDCIVSAHSFFLIIHRPEDQRLNIFRGQILQLKNNGTGQKRSIHLEIWILGRCTN